MPFTDWKLAPDHRDVLWVSSSEPPFEPNQMVPVRPGKSLNNTFFQEAYNKELVQTYVDNINVLYVAFTRAEKRLYAYSPMPLGEKLSTISDLMHQTLGGEISAEGLYELGLTEMQEKQKEGASEAIMKMAFYPSARWQSKLAISAQANVLWEIVDNEKSEGVNYGILIHDVLANIRVSTDIDKSINRLYHAGLINDAEKKELKVKVSRVLALPQVRDWFTDAWEVKNEREMLLPGGQVLRPDRVIIKDKRAIVIDYKTGVREKKHLDQVQSYGRVLEEMGYAPVEKYLLYINELHLFKVENSES